MALSTHTPTAGDTGPAVKPAPEDRRQHCRIPSPPVHASAWITVADIGLGGVCLCVARSLDCGIRFTLTLMDAVTHETKEFDVEVLWSAAGRVGLQWLGLTEGQEEWLRGRFPTWQEGSLHAQLGAAPA